MKNIPIVILNRDRLYPLIDQVNVLRQKGYNNITIIDNQSTYQPLLEWYKQDGLDVFYNDITENSCHAFRDLVLMQHPKFIEIVSNWYVFNDSDIIPLDTVPNDFIDDLIAYAIKYNKTKVGMSIKIDDLDLSYPLNEWVYSYESSYWTNAIIDGDIELYPHPIDTTFAVHAPNVLPTWSNNTLRVGEPYIVKHAPFYYNPESLPEDEKYYLAHMNKQSSNWSSKVEIK
jgi:hypothetical protein